MSYVLSLPRLRPDQWAIAAHPAKRKKLCMGRRWGKSTLGGAIAVAVANQGGHVGWGAPNYKNSRPLWRWIESVCRPLERVGIQISQAERVCTFPSGGFLGIYSLDNPDSIRSEAFHLFIVDEAAKVGSFEALDDALEPTLADYDGIRYDVSTPRGKNHFFTDYNLARADQSGFSMAWHAPSSANPSLNIRTFCESAKRRVAEGRMTERSYRQEILAEFVEGGAFFQNVRECSMLKVSQPEQHKDHKIVIGADFAQTEDFTVLDAFCITCHQELEFLRFNQISWTIQLERIKALCHKWGHEEEVSHQKVWTLAPILPERNSIGSPLIEQMQAAGLSVIAGPDGKPGFQTTAQTKQVLVKTTYGKLASQSIKLLDDAYAISEMESFEEKPTSYGAQYSAPAGLHDDIVIARCLAVYGAEYNRIQFW